MTTIKAKDKGDLFWSKMELRDNGVFYKKYNYSFEEIVEFIYSETNPILVLKRSWGVAFIKPSYKNELLLYARNNGINITTEE